jgi:hypothetical protein
MNAETKQSRDTGRRGPTQADILIKCAQSARLFCARKGTACADLDIDDHRETWPIRSKGFRRWLTRCFFVIRKGAPSSEALQSALNIIEAKAHFDVDAGGPIMTAGQSHARDRAAVVTTAVIQVLREAQPAWFDGQDVDIAAVRSEIERILRNEFEEIARQTRDEIALSD